jgi:hypothetical protein
MSHLSSFCVLNLRLWSIFCLQNEISKVSQNETVGGATGPTNPQKPRLNISNVSHSKEGRRELSTLSNLLENSGTAFVQGFLDPWPGCDGEWE